ncbi:hypothetical protein J7F01_17775 [Streptomyces sp. ISL-22]|uniref:hypothetical protein n=1 Tax=unclassified Streptomyces TaxID=2593676 RepID=UPI001BE6AC29|nr:MULTISPECIES: hypothetical protein [unclassified Streptomyces]MBT2420122.1 hypothetical protein [Streptomyces sp. ISL-24]MBT2433996.1 hypothetical protein [Streptomyces sp. ISL-22]
MAEVKVQFRDSYAQASFEGMVAPDGPTGYTFSGTLKVTCKLDRSRTNFKSMVALGHGGTSAEYTYKELAIADYSENVLKVEGKGTRTKNETVDFRVGVNTGLSGQFTYGDKAIVTAGGPPQDLNPTYTSEDSKGNTKYEVWFNGTARSDGPTGYVIQGALTGYSGPGALTTQYATFGYKTSGGSWQYETVSCDAAPKEITIRGRRKSGENIQVVVGATSQVLNLYEYGSEVNCTLPDDF